MIQNQYTNVDREIERERKGQKEREIEERERNGGKREKKSERKSVLYLSRSLIQNQNTLGEKTVSISLYQPKHQYISTNARISNEWVSFE